MPDRVFDEPRLADIYDELDPDRSDLDAYSELVAECGASSVVDIGCGTGTLACLLAAEGIEVVGVDPSAAMLAVAARKEHADLVRWIHGVAADVLPHQSDLAVMTGNVAQVFLDDSEWADTLHAVRQMLRPGGWFVFETRRPERKGWLEWNPEDSYSETEIPGVGVVASWYELLEVELPLVTFRATIRFPDDGSELVSDSTLRFRSRNEIVDSLRTSGFTVADIRQAPDRPAKEFVVLPRPTSKTSSSSA